MRRPSVDDAQDVVVGVRADTAGFARDVASMRAELEGPLTAGADKAGRAISATLLSAVQTGKLGFADLEKAALSALGSIASAALKSGLAGLAGGGSGSAGGLATSPWAGCSSPICRSWARAVRPSSRRPAAPSSMAMRAPRSPRSWRP